MRGVNDADARSTVFTMTGILKARHVLINLIKILSFHCYILVKYTFCSDNITFSSSAAPYYGICHLILKAV